MCEVADHAVMFDNATGIQNARLSNPGHRSDVAMTANEGPRCDRSANAHRSGRRDNGGERPSLRRNMLDLRPPFAIVSSRGETLPAVRRAVIGCLDDREA